MQKIEIKDLTLLALEGMLVAMGEEKYRARQVFKWLYDKCVSDFDQMTNIPIGLREKLAEKMSVENFETQEFLSKDGTIKFLFKLKDGLFIESVLIPMEDKLTLCISSQVGCPLGCKFCLTGKMGFKRNLSVSEIVEQVIHVKRILKGEKRITNIVFMGMGEPLLNYENVANAIDMIKSEAGLGFSGKKITLSTVGIPTLLDKIHKECGVKLAVSLNAPDNKTRSSIMPVNPKFPIEEVLDALRNLHLKGREIITFEYVIIDGVNDSPSQAKELGRILKSIRSKVNLIPLNEDGRIPFKKPSDENILRFRDMVKTCGVTVTLRKSKGLDIKGACGQLAGSANMAKRS